MISSFLKSLTVLFIFSFIRRAMVFSALNELELYPKTCLVTDSERNINQCGKNTQCCFL